MAPLPNTRLQALLYTTFAVFASLIPSSTASASSYDLIPTDFDASPFTDAPPPVPPPCTIQTQVCLPSADQPYSSHMRFHLPQSINATPCAISYTTSTGLRQWPTVFHIRSAKAGDNGAGIPCGLGSVMEFDSPFGQVEIVYKALFGSSRGNGGVPGDPWIS